VFALKRERVADVDKKEVNKELHNGNPGYEGHDSESMENVLGCPAAKDVASVHMPLPLNSNDLLNVPQRVHRHTSVSFGNVCLPKEKLIGAFLLNIGPIDAQCVGEVLNVIKHHPGNIVSRNHVVGRVLARAVAGNEP
jgi:hypothetical protein